MTFTQRELKADGYQGFLTIETLRSANCAHIPEERGVYMVLLPASENNPQFVEIGSGGHFKGKNPNVSLEVLKSNWVSDADVLYIGKAGGEGSAVTLRSRLKQYLAFGAGRTIGHHGGRFIWQLDNAEMLRVCWKSLCAEDPRKIESHHIKSFIDQYGMLPFTNLRR